MYANQPSGGSKEGPVKNQRTGFKNSAKSNQNQNQGFKIKIRRSKSPKCPAHNVATDQPLEYHRLPPLAQYARLI